MPYLDESIDIELKTYRIYNNPWGLGTTKQRKANTIFWMLYPVNWSGQRNELRRFYLMDKWIEQNPLFIRNGDILYHTELNSFWVGKFHYQQARVNMPFNANITTALRAMLGPTDLNDIANVNRSPLEKQLRAQLAAIEKELRSKSNSLQSSLALFQKHQDELLNDVEDEDIMEQLKLIYELPDVVGVSADGVNLIVDTDHFYVKALGVMHHIGQCRISIPIPSQVRSPGANHRFVGDVRVSNLTHNASLRPNGHHHPHVSSDGRPCLGEIASTMASFQKQFMLLEMVQMMLIYLKSVNTNDSWGRQVEGWPRADGYAPPCGELVLPADVAAVAKPDVPWYTSALKFVTWGEGRE